MNLNEDLKKEAEKQIDEVAPSVVIEETAKKGISWGKVGILALIGAGLGYLGFRAIKKHKDEKAVTKPEGVNTTEVNTVEVNKVEVNKN